MTTLRAISQTFLAAAVTATVIGGSLTGTAQANPYLPLPKLPVYKIPAPKVPVFILGFSKPGFPKPIYGGGYGYGAAALAGGLALGTMATLAARAGDDDCRVLRRVVVDDYGNEYVRHIRVCE